MVFQRNVDLELGGTADQQAFFGTDAISDSLVVDAVTRTL